MEDRLAFGKIHIIEWLKPTERRTGQDIYREIQPMLAVVEPRVPAILHRVGSRAAFLARLKRIEEDFRATRRVPLLHIETHGDSDSGIGPSDAGGLTWHELMEALSPLNGATGVRLPVILAACHGVWGIKMAQPMERSPFVAVLGPNRTVSDREVVRGMRAFYSGVLEYRDGNRAMRLLNGIIDPDRTTFGIYNCEQLFRDVWDAYLADHDTEEQIAERVERAVQMAQAKRPRTPAELASLRSYTRSYLLDFRARFEESRRHFFFIDQYPQNDARFKLILKLSGGRPHVVPAE